MILWMKIIDKNQRCLIVPNWYLALGYQIQQYYNNGFLKSFILIFYYIFYSC